MGSRKRQKKRGGTYPDIERTNVPDEPLRPQRRSRSDSPVRRSCVLCPVKGLSVRLYLTVQIPQTVPILLDSKNWVGK